MIVNMSGYQALKINLFTPRLFLFAPSAEKRALLACTWLWSFTIRSFDLYGRSDFKEEIVKIASKEINKDRLEVAKILTFVT